MDKNKVTKGQFFTKAQLWLKEQIKDFITDSNCKIAYDPFAGAGDLLKCSQMYGINETRGLDIDAKLGWDTNDSLEHIPHVENAIIITNPPYLSSYSASRKKVFDDVKKYFDASNYDDLYLIALDRMIESQKFIIAIIPETFINSSYRQKNKLSSITILEDNPFEDTDTPVCVACFDGVAKDFNKIKIYKNSEFVSDLETLESLRLKTIHNTKITFNTLNGWLGLRAVDSTNPNKMIHFDFKENFDYDWDSGIKTSSRLLSTIDIKIPENDKQKYIDECNEILSEIREKSKDIILSPFKGNMKNGKRRRRLDYYTARAIMEMAFSNLYGGMEDGFRQLSLF